MIYEIYTTHARALSRKSNKKVNLLLLFKKYKFYLGWYHKQLFDMDNLFPKFIIVSCNLKKQLVSILNSF